MTTAQILLYSGTMVAFGFLFGFYYGAVYAEWRTKKDAAMAGGGGG